MTFEKRKLADAEKGYAITSLDILGEKRIFAASEDRGPAVVFVSDPEMEQRIVSTDPGGSMGFAQVPGRDDGFYMITGFYPIFRAERAGIRLMSAVDRFNEPWTGELLVDLPFVHRIGSALTAKGDFLIAATICGGKDHRDDWSRPGSVLAFPIHADSSLGNPDTILDSIHRNHGMGFAKCRGVESLFIAGDEGVFALALPGCVDADGRSHGDWQVSVVIDHPVSEISLVDFDSDGVDELVVFEPFHGNRLGVYKNAGEGWNSIYKAELEFGHGLSAGMLAGEPVIIVGNRAGDKDLLCYQILSSDPFRTERFIVDSGTGTAGTEIVKSAWGDAIATSNPEYDEYALYIAGSEDT